MSEQKEPTIVESLVAGTITLTVLGGVILGGRHLWLTTKWFEPAVACVLFGAMGLLAVFMVGATVLSPPSDDDDCGFPGS